MAKKSDRKKPGPTRSRKTARAARRASTAKRAPRARPARRPASRGARLAVALGNRAVSEVDATAETLVQTLFNTFMEIKSRYDALKAECGDDDECVERLDQLWVTSRRAYLRAEAE